VSSPFRQSRHGITISHQAFGVRWKFLDPVAAALPRRDDDRVV
jgi:hypothetical protein